MNGAAGNNGNTDPGSTQKNESTANSSAVLIIAIIAGLAIMAVTVVAINRGVKERERYGDKISRERAANIAELESAIRYTE